MGCNSQTIAACQCPARVQLILKRVLITVISGPWEIEAGNGVVRTFRTGDGMLADDTMGEGHVSCVVGTEPHVFMTVPLAD